MTDYAYTRSSTKKQDGEGGLHLLTAAGIPDERVYFDRGVSGMKASRPRFDALKAVLQPGDTVFTPNLSRIGRSTKDVLETIETWNTQGVGLVILDLGGAPVDTRTPIGRFTITVLAAVNRLTRDFIAENTSAKLQALKAEGVSLGAPKKVNDAQLSAAQRMRKAGMPVRDIAAGLKVAPSTLYRALSMAEAAA